MKREDFPRRVTGRLLDRRPEPWRQHLWAADCVQVELGLLELAANRQRSLLLIQSELEQLRELEADIRENGLRTPLELVVDVRGKIGVTEGHHRIIVCRWIGMTHLPCRFAESEGLKYGTHLAPIMGQLLRTVR